MWKLFIGWRMVAISNSYNTAIYVEQIRAIILGAYHAPDISRYS